MNYWGSGSHCFQDAWQALLYNCPPYFTNTSAICSVLLLSAMAKFNASEILFYQSLFDFRPVFQQDVEHNSF